MPPDTTVCRVWEDRLAGSSPPLPSPPRRVAEQVPVVAEEVARWAASPAAEPDQRLQTAFRELVRRMRAEGVPTARTLESLAVLEDVLIDRFSDPGGAGSAPRIRLGLRGMLLDAIRISTALDARLSRERADALEFFGEVLVHEIGNRIGAAQTAVELLRTPGLDVSPEREEDLLRLIAQGVEQALKSVEDVTALMVAQARLEGEDLPVSEVLEQVVRTLNPVARRSGVRLDARVDRAGAVPVDAPRMRLILTNLAMNGIRYREPEREEPFVRLEAARGADELVVAVTDNGVGIPEEDREEVFAYRERGRAGRLDAVQGSGLGLAVVAEAADQMGAALELESRVGEGSTFRLRIPRSAQPPD